MTNYYADQNLDYDTARALVGKKYVFDDGDSIEVIQVKRREHGLFVTYHTVQSNGIPRKLILSLNEFLDHYGHLFDINT